MKEVKIYTSDGCQYCHAAKDYLDEKNIEYIEKNISQDQEARKELMKKGHMGVPVIIVGEEEIVGFDQNRLKTVLGL